MKLFVVAALAVVQGTYALNVHDFPKTSFSCRDKNSGEYYADPELGCQVYHICAQGAFNRLTKMSFACPNGTLFSQSSRICNSEDKVYCPLAERYYDNVQGTIDTQDDYRTVFKIDSQPVFPLEPARRRRPPPPPVQEDDYEDEVTTQAPRRQSNRRPSSRTTTSTTTTTTSTTPAPRQRPPQRQFTPQIPQPAQFEPQPPQDFRPPAGGFLPPRSNSRPPPPGARPQLGVTQPSAEYATPQRPSGPQFSPPPPPPQPSFIPRGAPGVPPPPPALPTQRPENNPPNRPNRPSLRRPSPFGGAPTTTPPPTTTVDPNAEYEYYDYEEPADGQQSSQ